jgi:SH3 domain-containing protein
MKNLQLSLISILLISCGGKNWNLTPDQFYYKNIKKFETNYSTIDNVLQIIQDQEFIDYWYSVLFKGESEESISEKMEYRSSYFDAWQSKEGSDFIEFTIASKNECELEIYYIVMDAKGKIVSHSLVAYDYTCVGVSYFMKTVVNNDGSFTKYEKSQNDDFLYPLETTIACKINDEGMMICDEPVAIKPIICLWEKLTIKETPSTKGKYLTSVYQGEVLTYLNESKIDEASKDKVAYLKVQLSDGTQGWVQSRFVAQEAGLGVLLDKSYTYSRPGEINKTDNFFNEMDIVGVFEFSDDRKWAKVKGKPEHEKWFKEGWVSTNKLSRYDADVKVAGLIKAALKEEKFGNRYDRLKMIVDNVEFQESNFLNRVNTLMTESPANKNAIRLKLQWSGVQIDQYGSTYAFVDENGKEFTFGYVEIEDWHIEIDKYATHYETEESMFGAHRINTDVANKWYWVTYEIQRRVPELADPEDEMDADVIIKIEPVE